MEEGLSAPKIARLCGLKDEQTIYYHLEKFGIRRRGFKEAALLVWQSKGKNSEGSFCSLQVAYREARKEWEKWQMKKLPKGWVVHHRDYNPWNNELWNLWAMPRSTHNKIHKRLVPGMKKHVYKIEQSQYVPHYHQELEQAVA